MIQLPHDIAVKDVDQWLSHGWFYAMVDGHPEVARLISVNGELRVAQVQLLDNDIAHIPSNTVVPFSKMYAHWPMCGALNLPPGGEVGKVAVFLTRLQKKQWKRTYNHGCLRVRSISNKPEHASVHPDSTLVVKAAFEPQYYTYTEAVTTLFPSGWASVALNPNLIVMNGEEEYVVFVDGETVGIIDKATNGFKCLNPAIQRRLLPHFDYKVE